MIRCACCGRSVPELAACRFVNEHRRPKRTAWLCRICNPREYGGFNRGKPGSDDHHPRANPADFVRMVTELVGA